MWQELNMSNAIPDGYAAIEEPLRELLRCTLTLDPKFRCNIGSAALFAERMLAAVKLDSDRIFEAQLSNKRFCRSQHGTAYASDQQAADRPNIVQRTRAHRIIEGVRAWWPTIMKRSRAHRRTRAHRQGIAEGSLPLHNAVPAGTMGTPELRGLDGSTIRDADAFLVPLIRKGLTKGTVESLESALTTGGNVSGALALRAALPLSLKAWDKYRPDLVIRSVIEIAAVRLDGDFSPVIALAQRPDLIEVARKEARQRIGLPVQFRIVSTPLDLLLIEKRKKKTSVWQDPLSDPLKHPERAASPPPVRDSKQTSSSHYNTKTTKQKSRIRRIHDFCFVLLVL